MLHNILLHDFNGGWMNRCVILTEEWVVTGKNIWTFYDAQSLANSAKCFNFYEDQYCSDIQWIQVVILQVLS